MFERERVFRKVDAVSIEERAVPERGKAISGNGVSERIGGLRSDEGVPGLLLRFVSDGLEVSRGLLEEVVWMWGSFCRIEVFLAAGKGAYGVEVEVSRSDVIGVLVLVSLSKDVL